MALWINFPNMLFVKIYFPGKTDGKDIIEDCLQTQEYLYQPTPNLAGQWPFKCSNEIDEDNSSPSEYFPLLPKS